MHVSHDDGGGLTHLTPFNSSNMNWVIFPMTVATTSVVLHFGIIEFYVFSHNRNKQNNFLSYQNMYIAKQKYNVIKPFSSIKSASLGIYELSISVHC